MPKTGTLSTFAALEKILPGKCYHMFRVFRDKEPPEFWIEAKNGGVLDKEKWKEFIEANSLSAGVDFPMSLYWKDLAKMYPNAKVLLTVRDPRKWYESVNNTILQVDNFVSFSWWALPIRWGLLRVRGGYKRFLPGQFSCYAPTYLGARYPKGMFGAVIKGIT